MKVEHVLLEDLYTRTCACNSVIHFYLCSSLPGRNGDHHGPPTSIHVKLHASSQKQHLEHNITNTSSTHHQLSPPITRSNTLTLRRSIPFPNSPLSPAKGNVTFTWTAY